MSLPICEEYLEFFVVESATRMGMIVNVGVYNSLEQKNETKDSQYTCRLADFCHAICHGCHLHLF